jgi:hypothetical protein
MDNLSPTIFERPCDADWIVRKVIGMVGDETGGTRGNVVT